MIRTIALLLTATAIVSCGGCGNGSAAGCHPVPLTTRSADPAGATYYSYANGVTQVVPPPDFDPLAATAEQLRKYGFPARPPRGTPARADWDRAMKHAKHAAGAGFDDCPNERA